MNSKQNFQKASYSLFQLESEIQHLKLVNEYPPCIVISGLRHLSLTQMLKQNDIKSVIISLFQLLNIPTDWILAVKPPSHSKENEEKLPFDAYIYLIDDHIKFRVYKMLLKHIKFTRQTKIHLKIIN
jgi:hypothetical protein